jgi:hypothetical protein
MAAKKTETRRTFYEVVFNGKPKVVRAFLKGFLMGTHDEAEIYYSFNSGIHHEGKVEKLTELVGIRGTDCHVVVDADTSDLLKQNARRIAEETGLEIVSHRFIRSASMAIKYHAYSRKYDEQVKDLVQDLPTGLRLDGWKRKVAIDPKAKGIEAYSVVHDFEAHGEGTLVGRIDLLVAMKKRMADYPLIVTADIVLKLA